jgi:hypothetical protein
MARSDQAVTGGTPGTKIAKRLVSGCASAATRPASNACAIVILSHIAGFASTAIDG